MNPTQSLFKCSNGFGMPTVFYSRRAVFKRPLIQSISLFYSGPLGKFQDRI